MNTFLAVSKIFASLSFTWGKSGHVFIRAGPASCWKNCNIWIILASINVMTVQLCMMIVLVNLISLISTHTSFDDDHLRLFIEPQVFETELCFLEDFQSVCISSSCFFILQLESWLPLKVMTASNVWNGEFCCWGDFQSDWVSSSASFFHNWNVDLT